MMTVATWSFAARQLHEGELSLTPVPGDTALTEARALGVDADAVFRTALARAVMDAKAHRWMEENRTAIEAHAEWIARHGVPLARPRPF